MLPIKRIISKQLGELLLESDIISKSQLEKALEIQKQKGKNDRDGLIGQILVALGYVTEEEIAQVLTIQYGFPFLPLESYEISPEAIKLISENVARQYNLIAIDRIEDIITISMSNPLNTQAVEDVEMITKCKVHVFVSTMTDVTNAIKKYYGKKQE